MFKQLIVGLGAVVFGAFGAFGLFAGRTWAAPPPGTSLNNCQNAVKVAARQFVANKTAAIGACLQAVSTQIVKHNNPDASGAAASCVASFRKLNDSRGLGKQLSDKLDAAITKKCDPSYQTAGGSFPNTHTLADIIGSGAGVPHPLNAESLGAWCSRFGGDGSIDSLPEWIDCIAAAAECDVDSAIAAQYPRVLDWLNLARTAMNGVSPPAMDPTKVTDAIAGLTAVETALDANGDHVIKIQCGSPLLYLPKTGQTASYGAGDDGDLQNGEVRSYTDNGDGTITDLKTGLMWEQKDQSGGIHDVDNLYTWSVALIPNTAQTNGNTDGTLFTDFLTTLNAGTGFAGHTDWRIPNLFELESLVTLDVAPAVDAAFNTGCVASCTSCSCTLADAYWSSSTKKGEPRFAWLVDFSLGNSTYEVKVIDHAARAVRGGL